MNKFKNIENCHPRESGDPVGIFSFFKRIAVDQKNSNWVPAFAGMTRVSSCIVLACLIALPAFAADATKPASATPPISDKDCAQIVDYQPSADVNYKPGVDVNGKPVVPADLAPPVIDTPKKISFDLNANYAGQLGITLPAGSQGLATIGKVTVDTVSGEVTWNGKPIEGDAMAALKAACAAKKAPDSSQNPPK